MLECAFLPFHQRATLSPGGCGDGCARIRRSVDINATRASLTKSLTREQEGARAAHDAVAIEERLDVCSVRGERVALPPLAIQAALSLFRALTGGV